MHEVSQHEKRTKSEALAILRGKIRALEGHSQEKQKRPVYLGIKELDQSLPGGSFPIGAIHDFRSFSREAAAITSGFVGSLCGLIPGHKGAIIWITKSRLIFPPGLKKLGLDPARVIFVELPRPQEMLWAMEESLRCKGLTAVIAEIPDADLTATRRLQLAVEDSGVTGFLLRENPKKTGSSACMTAWQITALPSAFEDGKPGVAFPRLNVELIKARNGRPGSWQLEWKAGTFRQIQPSRSSRTAPNILSVAR